MLFADPAVRDFIAKAFLPAWESVRAVPTVTIEFGDGRALKRTVNGNVATYLCAPDGRVLDILPGLSTPEAFLQDLQTAARLLDHDIPAYHQARLALPARAARPPGLDAGKTMGVEPRVKRAILAADRALLEADTRSNREIRKPKIHAMLAERAWTPAELTKRVYRDVLDCDLDDPYLGLGLAAFGGGAYGKP